MSRGKATKDGSLDKFGWGARSEEEPKKEQEENPVETLSEKKSKQDLGQIDSSYEVDPLICLKCGSEMVVLAIITNPEEVHKILNHLRKNKSPPFDNKTHPEAS